MTASMLTRALGFIGLVPFLVPSCVMVEAALLGNGLQSAAIFGLYAPYVFIAYSAVILSFLSGTLWSQARQNDDSLALMAILFSNLLALSAWAYLLLIYIAPIMTIFSVCLLLAGYLGLLVAESLIGINQDRSYWRMRLWLTLWVGLAHLLVISLMVLEL